MWYSFFALNCVFWCPYTVGCCVLGFSGRGGGEKRIHESDRGRGRHSNTRSTVGGQKKCCRIRWLLHCSLALLTFAARFHLFQSVCFLHFHRHGRRRSCRGRRSLSARRQVSTRRGARRRGEWEAQHTHTETQTYGLIIFIWSANNLSSVAVTITRCATAWGFCLRAWSKIHVNMFQKITKADNCVHSVGFNNI